MIQCRTVYVKEMNGKRVERDELSKEVNEKRCQQKDGKWGNWRFVGIDGRCGGEMQDVERGNERVWNGRQQEDVKKRAETKFDETTSEFDNRVQKRCKGDEGKA